MLQHKFHLLWLAVAANFTLIALPSYAQTAVKLSNENNAVSVTEINVLSNLSNPESSTTIKPVALSEKSSNTAADTTKKVENKKNTRFPIYSRIFPIPSMQQ